MSIIVKKELICMKNNTRKIVVLNNIDSPRIEQAIFILKEEASCPDESAAVKEAQRIVDTYVKNLYSPILKKQKKKPQLRLIFTAALYICSMVVLGAYLLSFIK